MFISKKKYSKLITSYYKLLDIVCSQEKTINQYRVLLNKEINKNTQDIDFPNSEERGFTADNTGFNDDPNDILFN